MSTTVKSVCRNNHQSVDTFIFEEVLTKRFKGESQFELIEAHPIADFSIVNFVGVGELVVVRVSKELW